MLTCEYYDLDAKNFAKSKPAWGFIKEINWVTCHLTQIIAFILTQWVKTCNFHQISITSSVYFIFTFELMMIKSTRAHLCKLRAITTFKVKILSEQIRENLTNLKGNLRHEVI